MNVYLKSLFICLLVIGKHAPGHADWTFTDVSEEAGAKWRFELDASQGKQGGGMAGGVAAGDYDRDGDIDLYVLTGDSTANALLQNDGDGHFSNLSEVTGVGLVGHRGQGPAFADIDADGWLDLVVGGIAGDGYRVFKNNADGSFSLQKHNSGITQQSQNQDDFSSAFGDADGDGDLDVFISHWGTDTPVNHLWTNTGEGHFVAADEAAGIDAFLNEDWTFSPIFTDINGDGSQDLVVSGDYGTSQVFANIGRASFKVITTEVIDDENGMGASTGDYDNDGDLDWFVSSIYDKSALREDWGQSGNRLYANNGDGSFSNVTETAAVADGSWGWGACSADFNNDGWLDIFHVNGMLFESNIREFQIDTSRLFINKKDGTFIEQSASVGIVDTKEGRGVVCFDYDKDGDIDIFISNYEDETRLYRNDLDQNQGWLQVRLEGEINNPSAVGAVIRVTTGEITQMREVTIGSNFQSQNPLLQHFGLGSSTRIDELRVGWPHGGETVLTDVAPNQQLLLSSEAAKPAPFRVEAGHSSAWYDVSHNGEGFVLEIHRNSVAVVYWFTYDKTGNQDWYIGTGKVIGRRVLFGELLRVSGGEFGPGFDSQQIEVKVIGTAAFTFTSCASGFMDWSLNETTEKTAIGRQELSRLTNLMGLDCGRAKGAPERMEARYSGSWYDPAHDGEGFVLEVLSNSNVLIYWFSYDKTGNRRWFFGVGEIQDGKLVIEKMYTTTGGVFGDDFDPDTVEHQVWGRLEIDIDCNSGTASWTSNEDGFGPGVLNLRRLTTLADLSCEN